MERSGQNFANHTRLHAPFHYFALPVVILHFFWSCIQLWRNPGFPTVEATLLAAALVVICVLVRVNSLRAQDRVIRLEEQLRFQRLLPADLAAQASAQLREDQYVALRFASDAELADLVRRILAGNPSQPSDIKKAIRDWRGDYFRV